MKKVFALFSVERNSTALMIFTKDSLSINSLSKIRGGGETSDHEGNIFVFDKK